MRRLLRMRRILCMVRQKVKARMRFCASYRKSDFGRAPFLLPTLREYEGNGGPKGLEMIDAWWKCIVELSWSRRRCQRTPNDCHSTRIVLLKNDAAAITDSLDRKPTSALERTEGGRMPCSDKARKKQSVTEGWAIWWITGWGSKTFEPLIAIAHQKGFRWRDLSGAGDWYLAGYVMRWESRRS